MQDLMFAWRALARRPTFAIIAIVTLALGIGLNTSMFALANALLFRPLPFPNADRIVRLYRATPDNLYGDFSPADYMGLKAGEESFGRFAAYRLNSTPLDDVPGTTQWMLASSEIFDILGVRPFMGRGYTVTDDQAGARVAVITYRLWQNQFAGAADVVGRIAHAGGNAVEIIGVLPERAQDHRLFGRVGLFSPLATPDTAARRGEAATRVGIIARRRADMSAAAGESFVAAAGARIGAATSTKDLKVTWRSEGLPLSTTGPTGKLLVAILIGLATSVLLIACSNLANVLLAGAIERRRESAVRAALGASRLQLVRPALFEAGLLALAGGSAALVVAAWTSRWLRANLTDAGGIELPLDWRVLGFAALSCLLTAAFVSMAPALFALRTNPNVALSSGGRTLTSGVRQRRLRNALIATQFAFATILLATAGVFLSGTAGMLSQDYGWRSDHVLQGNVQLTADRYRDEADIAAFYARVTGRLRGLPGVESASVSYGLPYVGLSGSTNVQADAGGGRRLRTMLNGVSPEYFRVTGTQLLSGRAFTDADTAASAPVVIVSDSLARACFPEQRAEGRRVVVDDDGTLVSMEIVGVVADTQSVDIAQSPNRFQLYQAVAQDPRTSAAFALRTTGVPPQTLASAVRAAIADLDAGVLVKDVAPADTLVHSLDSQIAIVRQLLAAFAALGLFLALIGIYGVISRMVVQRTAEMGIRMALGAQAAGLLVLIVGAGIRVSGIGAAVGVLGALAVSRALAAGFPGMQVNTLLISAASVTVLLAVALTVCLLSARRVTTIDPVVALRID